MTNTVISVYDNFAQAQSALKQLLAAGLGSDDVRLRPADDTPQSRVAALKEPDITGAGSHSRGGTLRNFFSELFGTSDAQENDADRYSEAVRRGSFVLTARANNEDQRDAAAAIMEQFQPIDIDERAARWQASGWRTHDETALPLTEEELVQERNFQGAVGQTADRQEAAIPVIQEELKVGKREVQRGGVRVFQHMSETPVQQTVNLREEHVSVERHAVDKPATMADLNGMKEGTIELREMAEEAVVAKTARVVEEVVIAKEVQEKQETINDTVRRTEVEVEPVIGAASTADTTASTHLIDEDFRHHWQSAYGQGSEDRFEDYAPAYHYGATLANDQRYRGRDWQADESAIRQEWESRHPHNAWEKVKDAVHYGWSKIAH